LQIDDLNLLFVHIHHLLNEFRPHQARETLRVMMEMQKRQRLETVERFNKHLEHVRKIVNTAFKALPIVKEEEEIDPDEIEREINALNAQNSAKYDRTYHLDRIMCNIIDNLDL